jgi:hypothetical protein
MGDTGSAAVMVAMWTICVADNEVRGSRLDDGLLISVPICQPLPAEQQPGTEDVYCGDCGDTHRRFKFSHSKELVDRKKLIIILTLDLAAITSKMKARLYYHIVSLS